jgi:hypothetical protein
VGLDDEKVRVWSLLWQALRGPLSFTLGASILIYEMTIASPIEGQLLLIGAGLVGLPIFAPEKK